MIGDVLAAPDLVRYSLVGRDALALRLRSGAVEPIARVRVQRLPDCHRRRGMPVPNLSITRTAMSARGFLSPTRAAAVTLAATPKIPPPSLLGAIVTMERQGGGDTPSGEPLLARMPLPPPAS